MRKFAESLDNRALCRLYRILHKRVEKLFAGGLRFGWDMPTLRVCHPELAEAIVTVAAVGRERKNSLESA